MSGRAAGLVLVGGYLAVAGPLSGQQRLPPRMVIATNVACRTAPDTAAPAVRQYLLGTRLWPRDESDTGDGPWYFDTARSRGCWIHGSLTAEASDLESALLAAADRLLARPDDAPFEDHVAVANLLDRTVTRAHSDTTVLETSPLLQLRRLRVLDRAARAPGTDRWAVAREPLMVAWFHAHEDVLLAYEPAGRWLLPADVYWDLFERHRDTPWAEEMAWAAARAAVPADECYAVCQLRRVSRTFARYWAAFPAGRWVPEALETTLPIFAAAAGGGCRYSAPEEATEWAADIRNSLEDVTAPGRDEVLAALEDVERACGGTAPSSPRRCPLDSPVYGKHYDT